jgi:hypothetical protein
LKDIEYNFDKNEFVFSTSPKDSKEILIKNLHEINIPIINLNVVRGEESKIISAGYGMSLK